MANAFDDLVPPPATAPPPPTIRANAFDDLVPPKVNAFDDLVPPIGGGSPELRGSVEGPDGSAVPEGTTASAAPASSVTKPSAIRQGLELAGGMIPTPANIGRQITSVAGGLKGAYDAITSEDTPAQVAAKERIRQASTQVDDSSLLGDLAQGYNSYTKGNLGVELSNLHREIEKRKITPAKIGEADLATLEERKAAAIKALREKHLAPQSADNPTYAALNMEESSDAATALKNTIAALGADPWGVVRSAAAQSGMASVPSIVGGVMGATIGGVPGASVGAGLGSYQSEYGSSIIEGLQHFGADLSDEASIDKVWREKAPEIMSRSNKKAASVAFWDAIGGGVEGRIAMMPVRGLAKRAGQITAGAGVSSGTGMAGEATGQIAQDGGIRDYNAVYQEALGEVVPGAITEAGQIVGQQIKKFNPYTGEMPSEEELKRLWNESHPEDQVATYKEAVNSGRTIFGWAEEGKPTQIGTYDEIEAIAGQGDFRRGKIIALSPDQVESVAPRFSVDAALDIIDNPLDNPKGSFDEIKTSVSNPTEFLRAVNRYDTEVIERNPNAQANLRSALAPLLTPTSGYTGPTFGLGITPREDNFLFGTMALGTKTANGRTLWSLKSRTDSWGNVERTENALDLDQVKEKVDEQNLLVVPGGIARRYHSNPDFAAVVDDTFNFSSPEARQVLLVSENENALAELFSTGQVTWKGRLDPRVLTAGLYDSYSGFQIIDSSGQTLDYDAAQELLASSQQNFTRHTTVDRAFGPMMHPYGRGIDAETQADDKWLADNAPSGVVAFGDHPNIEAYAGYLERLRKLGGMRQKIVLVLARSETDILGDRTWSAPGLEDALPGIAKDLNRSMHKWSQRNGFFSVNSADSYVIAITDDVDPNSIWAWQETEIMQTIQHEFGHAMVAGKLMNAPLATLLSIYGAYRRHRAAFDSVPSDSRNEELLPGSWEARQKSPFRKPGGSPYSYGAMMEEWLAEQTARWAVSEERPTGLITKFFKNTSTAIKSVLKGLTEKGVDFSAEKEFTDWMNAIVDGTSTAEYTATIENMKNIATTFVNGKVDETPVPAHEDSAAIYSVLDEFGPKRQPFMSQAMKSAVTNTAVTKAVVDKYNWFYKWAANIRQLAEANPHITELQVVRELFAFAKMESSKIMVSADTALQKWRQLGEQRAEALSAFLFDLNEMNYLSDTERQAGVMRWPTQQEFIDLATQYRLDNDTLAVYREVRDFFLETVKREEALKLEDAMKIQDPKLQAEAIAAAKATSVTLISKPYFPQSRFGKYSITVRSKANGKLEHFELFETKREAKAAAYQATRMWPEADWDIVQGEMREDVQNFVGMSPWMLDKIRNMPGLTKDQLLWIDELRYQIAPSQSFTKHMMRRKKYSGFSRDGRRTFAAYAFHHARNYPRVKFAEAFREAIKSLDQSLPPGHSPLDLVKRKPMADMVQHQVNEFMNPSQDWAQLRALNAIWHLGFNAKSAVVNMTQVFFSAAFLGAKFGGTKAERSILAAGAKLNSFYRKGAYEKSTDAEFQAIDRAMKDGHIDESMAAELAALAVGGGMGTRVGKSLVGDKFLHGYIGFTEKAMWMFRMAEQWQRRVVFRAAWQLAIDNPSNEWVNSQEQKNPLLYAQLLKEGWTPRQALAYLSGVDALQSTIGVYDRDSRARYAQGRKSVMFAFQTFTQQMLWTLWNNKDMWARYMLYYAVIGGSMGIIPEDMKGLLTLLGRMLFGNQFNLERSTRQFVADMMGEDSPIPPDLILHGTARYGFGFPMVAQTLGAKFVPDVDLSASITLNRLVPLDLGKINMPGAKFHDILSTQVEAASGAAYGIPVSMWKAIAASDMEVTDFKRWESAMPAAMRNVSKAFRYGFGQGERDRNFATTVGFDGEDPEHLGEIIATAMGFRPTRISQVYDRKTAAYEIDKFWTVRKQMLMRQAYRDRFVYKDTEAYKETMRQIQAYNKEVFDKKYLITREGLKTSMQNRAKATTKVETGQTEGPGLRTALDQMYPETVESKKVK